MVYLEILCHFLAAEKRGGGSKLANFLVTAFWIARKWLSPDSAANIKRIYQLLFPLKWSENHRFSDDYRGNRSWLIRLNSLNIRSNFWRRSRTKNQNSRFFRKKNTVLNPPNGKFILTKSTVKLAHIGKFFHSWRNEISLRKMLSTSKKYVWGYVITPNVSATFKKEVVGRISR